ncbi:MAG: hypothetical protein M1840_004705 [Geoglossum simile]|nr:MAG: hypothetical protein M1840_004705 [Geoglossum simile]
MEVFIRNTPDRASEEDLNKFFRSYLAQCEINSYYFRKLKSRGCATITIADEVKGRTFLNHHGKAPGLSKAKIQLKLWGREIYCSASHRPPEKYLVQSLQKEAADKLQKSKSKKSTLNQTGQTQRQFQFASLSCGLWSYNKSGDVVFEEYFRDDRRGTVMFGTKTMTLLLDPPMCRVDIPYPSVESVTTGTRFSPTITLLLTEAPRMFDHINNGDLTSSFSSLNIQTRPRAFKRKRVTSISSVHASIVNSCYVYRLSLTEPTHFSHVHNLLTGHREMMPPTKSWPTKTALPHVPFSDGLSQMNSALATTYISLPFGIRFQVQKLVQNTYLPPTKAVLLLPELAQMFYRSGETITVNAVRKLFHQIPFAGPNTEASQFGIDVLKDLLRDNEEACKRESSYKQNLTEIHDHIALVHTAKVTPAGIYLHGPEAETKNRVLRTYRDFTDYFLRVSFLDEDYEPIRFDRHASLVDIFHARFKRVLEGAITIAGRPFEFLGFSHSSLRSQTCWFMAPFTYNGELHYARSVIAKLGDFSQIRSPAKCAARIGQAFSETFSTIHVPNVQEIPDVRRFNRVFSDGVGTISTSVLQRIWKEYALSRELKPTLFQIRYADSSPAGWEGPFERDTSKRNSSHTILYIQSRVLTGSVKLGAKGMISLDNRLDGDVLNLRGSMIKFKGSPAQDIEICGAAFRPLPLYLNRQTIKILEDLGVEDEVFLELQKDAVEKLRCTTLSPINAASFLERNSFGKAAQLPWLIKKLDSIKFPFQEDPFLRQAIELAVLFQLRELKHRSRILVEEGYTLYGIMDETNFLEEGEIFCVTETEKDGRFVILGNVTITRAPALHPGDIQVVTAVEAPADSPLNALHNCVVFSQRGRRDLPSQLSGGDLDGDLYNIIVHPGLRPERTHEPADYPIVPPFEIAGTVERRDMTDFFIRFMENDQLGRIAMLHQTFADQKEKGTLDPDCIDLANMHSTAVDFSKSGIPVDMTKLPKNNICRPDFMATGPRVKIEKDINLDATDPSRDDDEEDVVSALDPDGKGYRYYESKKVLGKLYRAIDERSFFAELQEQSKMLGRADQSGKTTMERLWDYVQKEIRPMQWRHLEESARDIKEMYEDFLMNTMSDFSSSPLRRLSEVEVFVGTIIGKNGMPNKRLRESSTGMKDQFDRDVAFVVDCITKDGKGLPDMKSLERSVACLSVAMEGEGHASNAAGLRSFKYVAAAVCLKEIERFQGWYT